MISDYVKERYDALYAPTYEGTSTADGNANQFVNTFDPVFREIDWYDPRNFLLNLLNNVHRNLLLINPRLLGLQITKVFSTASGNARVTYTVVFTYKETRSNVLLDEPTLEAITAAPIP